MLKQTALLTMALFASAFIPAVNVSAAESGPLKAEIQVGTDTYALDPAQSGKEFADKLRAAEKTGAMPVKPPKVNLTLRVTNTNNAPVKILGGGDGMTIDLALKGPGALNLHPEVMMTFEYRMGPEIVLEPGKSHDFPVTSLSSGMRGMTILSYWTEPGEYTLTATYTSTVEGGPKITATSEPVKLKVVEGGGSSWIIGLRWDNSRLGWLPDGGLGSLRYELRDPLR